MFLLHMPMHQRPSEEHVVSYTVRITRLHGHMGVL